MGRLGKGACSSGEQVAEARRANARVMRRGRLAAGRGWQPRGRAVARVRGDDAVVARFSIRGNMTVAVVVGHRAPDGVIRFGWSGIRLFSGLS